MLSVVITTWNEAENLPRAVKSARLIADEIVVVDTQSTDNTVAIASKLGCKVYHHKNTGIVEPVRNFSISKAKGEWILLLDADEVIPQELAVQITKTIKANTADYFRLPRKNIIFGKHITSDHWWPDYVYRLFRKGFVVWSDAIHSIPVTRGRGGDFPAIPDQALIHHNYQDISQFLNRLNRYTDYQLNLLTAQAFQFSWGQLISAPAQEFLRQFFARRGYKDGVHGLALASLQGFSEMVVYLKLWQSQQFKQEEISLAQYEKYSSIQFKQLRWWLYEVRGPMYRLFRRIKTLIV